MTDRELFEKALKALKDVVDAEEARSWGVFGVDKQTPLKRARSAITALRERLAQPEQEPVAWLHRDSWGTLKLSQTMPPPVGAFPVYTAPQQEPVIDKSAAIRIATALGWEPRREWVGLTDEERNNLWREVVGWGDPSHDDEDLMKAIEAKLKEKNT